MPNKILRSIFSVGVIAVSLSGCASLGPKSIGPDRIDYIQEIGESWKKQMLLNIVKLRYFDPPTFLDVSSIINQYGIENQVNADARWYWPIPSASYGASAGAGGYSRYSDKPTITYTPLSGQQFTRNLLTPIPPVAVVSLIQSGWPIDMIFFLTVKTINGVKNSSSGKDFGNEKTDFTRLIEALREVQLAGVTDIRLEKTDEKEAVIFVISDTVQKEQYREQTQTIRKILNIKPDLNSYQIVFGSIAKSDNEIAMLTRSMLEIMIEMGATVQVPAKHVAEGRVKEVKSSPGNVWMLTKIYSSRDKPKDAFTAVNFQDHWFWIDNKDINSKRNFALLMIFLSLTETEQKSSGPVLSI
jgi:hypothetical protein